MKKTYNDLPVPNGACIFKTGTHTSINAKGVEVTSHSFCRIICAPDSKYCPRHAVMMDFREEQKEERKRYKAELLRKGMEK